MFGIPETFFGDVKHGQPGDGHSALNRSTELNFIEKQESWREDLETIAQYVLGVESESSWRPAAEEAMEKRKLKPADVVIRKWRARPPR